MSWKLRIPLGLFTVVVVGVAIHMDDAPSIAAYAVGLWTGAMFWHYHVMPR